MIEESGYDSDKIVQLGRVHPNPAIQGNICFSFLAENVHQVDQPVALGNEETEVVLVPMTDIRELIASGAIMHALTIAAFSFMHVYNRPHVAARPRATAPRVAKSSYCASAVLARVHSVKWSVVSTGRKPFWVR